MKRFKLIEHTADVGLIAYGESLEEAFANAAYGLFSIIADLKDVKEKESRKVVISEDDIEVMLVEWLNNLIFFFDVERLLFNRFEIKLSENHHLAARCYGEEYDPRRHHVKLGVKAATYHMLRVDEEKHQVQVIFDV